jgi:dTMP kinase
MLVVIEGLDGAGKSTQVKMAKEYIQSNGVNLKYLHFPRYEGSIYGELIARFLRGEFGTIDTVHPQLVALLFAEDRHDAATQIRKWIDEGYTVLLDRYVYSNIAYQCSKLSNPDEASRLRDWIFETEYGVFGIPKPDINIFLDVPLNFVDKMLKESREGDERDYLNGKTDIHEASIDFQSNVRKFYIAQTEADKNFIRIDCSNSRGEMLPPDKIFEKISPLLPVNGTKNIK